MVLQGKTGHPLGLHRVIDRPLCLPQAAQKLSVKESCLQDEIEIDVTHLQIDSASFKQLSEAYASDEAFALAIQDIIFNRGKMQNPITGSGGMLLGRVVQIGEQVHHADLILGTQIATLISLTATPLEIKKINHIDRKKERLQVTGKAYLYQKALWVKMPDDLPLGASLAAFDVCGAPLLSVKNVQVGDTVFILGLGKAGRSVVAALSQTFGQSIQIYGIDLRQDSVDFCNRNYKGQFAAISATDPIAVMRWLQSHHDGKGADFVVNTANIAGTEMSSILSVADGGRCLFFGMATNFQNAALGAESVGADITMLIGSGYTKGHADYMIELLRKDKALREYFVNEFGEA